MKLMMHHISRKSEYGFSLQELMVVVVLIGLLASVSFYSWDLLYCRAKLRSEVYKLNNAMRLAYKDAVSNEVYIGIVINYYKDQRSNYLIYLEKNGVSGYQDGIDEKISLYYFPINIKIESTEGFIEDTIVINPSGLLKGKFDSSKCPGYAHIEFSSSEIRSILCISKICELKYKMSEE